MDITVDFLRSLIHPRPEEGHKGTFGHAILIAGRYGMAGASILAARACMRSGVGKLTVHTPRRNNDILQTSIPEAIVQHDKSEVMFTEAVNLSAYDALAIGPGLGTDEAAAEALHRQLQIASEADIPTIIDADGLNILSMHPDWWTLLPPRTIITPHLGELKRLEKAGISTNNVILVKKGHPTTVHTPLSLLEKSGWGLVLCPYGNSGMATAGSGDVLTGIILGLLAQKYTPCDAAILGVSLHAISGDIAAQEIGLHSVIASDIVEHLGQAFKSIV